MRVQQLPLDGREGHEAILRASYLDDIPDALAQWQSQWVLLLVSTSLDTKTDIIHDLEERLSHYGDKLFKKTDLSAGEWNSVACVTNPQGKKQHFAHIQGASSRIILDPRLAATTPAHLWLASGMRAVDHFVEGMCPHVPPRPRKLLIQGFD
ncbi:hypothetical protein BDV59DRAFT_204142 [Aspergillus ambiguus]|uniref:uncharacterized protein n=1 Tax=Aspergillus ambiguus TaxID=176160 RepID=UPI003CCD15F9